MQTTETPAHRTATRLLATLTPDAASTLASVESRTGLRPSAIVSRLLERTPQEVESLLGIRVIGQKKVAEQP